jgi:hypothetical protein
MKTAIRTHISIVTSFVFLLLITAQAVSSTKAFGADLVIGGPLGTAQNFSFSESKPAKATEQLPAMLDSEVDQLQHENNMALIETAMRVGEICVLLAVQKHAVKHSKPISLNELSKQSNVCVKTHLKSLDRK